jgi:hypothetical protein
MPVSSAGWQCPEAKLRSIAQSIQRAVASGRTWLSVAAHSNFRKDEERWKQKRLKQQTRDNRP